MKLTFMVLLLAIPTLVCSQINSFPSNESFESAFSTGTDIAFITNWTGNDVRTTSRIFKGSDARTGGGSLNIIPTSTFSGEVLISLDFTGISNPKVSFYAFSKQNGSGTSTRPVLLNFSTSIDGGNNFLDNVQIGDDTTFPNNNTTSYTLYEYELPTSASGASNIIVRLAAARGSGSGSAAELVLDDFSIEEQILPLSISNTTANSATEVVVAFNQEVTQVTAEQTANYSIDNGITVSNASRTSSSEVTLTTSALPNNNYQLTVNNVEDAASNTAATNLTSNFSFVTPLAIESVTVLDENSIEVDFNLNLEQTSAETLSNYSVDNGLSNPSNATLSGADNSIVTLDFSSNLDDNTYQLTVNGVTDQSTLASANNLTDSFSYLPLAISSISANSATEIEITFNQNVQTTGAETELNFSIDNGIGTPTQAVQNGGNASIVTLSLGTPMVNNTHQVSINSVQNTSGNSTAANLQASFKFNTATNSREIVINEIFADPSGSNQPNPLVLPNNSSDEFIELHNTSTNAIEITDFDMAGGTVGSFVLGAGDFVILTATSNVTDFQSFGNVVGVTSWNSLTNGGEQLILRDNLGNIVDSLTYSTDWYKDANKADGGWSLEQINPELVCSDNNNWNSSNDGRGASPASQNSVYDNSPDITSPNLVSIIINSPTQIVAVFDEIMDAASLTGAIYALDNGATVNSISPNSPSLRSVTLDLVQPMISGTLYGLTITGVTDCAGNNIGTDNLSYTFDNEAPVFDRFILKDNSTIDLLFDEDIVESIAETEANYSFNNGIGAPSSAILNDSDNKRVRLSFSNEFTLGNNYTLTYQNITDLYSNVVALSNESFNFQSQIDTVIVITDQLLDVYFDQDVNTTAEATANYTVDNSIGSPSSANIDGSNARLVHLAFNSAFPENRDLEIEFESIQNSGNNFLQLLNTTFRYDTDNPDLDSLVVLDENSIQLYFDERLDETTAEAINNYSANNDLGLPASAILQDSDSSVILNFGTEFTQELENELTYSGIEDLSGNTISTNRRESFTFDRLPPRLNGVTLVSPNTLNVDFSEELVKSVAENTNNYSVDNGIGNPVSAVRSEKNTNEVLLTFSDLGNNAINTLTISNLSDLFSNSVVTTLIGTFSTQDPDFGTFTILTDTTVQIQFTKPLTQASAEERENYGFDKGLGPDAITQDPSDASIVSLDLTTNMTEGVSYRLVVTNLEDTDGNILDPQPFDFSFDDYLETISIINANTLLLDFSLPLNEGISENATNYSLNNTIGSPNSAVLGSADSTQVTLIFANSFTESETYELTVSNLKGYYGEIIPHSKNQILYDVTPPSIQSIQSTYLNEIEVTYNERVDQSTAFTLNHYSLNNGIGQPTDIRFTDDSNQSVILTFPANLTEATQYTLTVDRVEDVNGKALNNEDFIFTFSAPVDPSFRDLVINEVYFDNDLSSGIPNAEFIEIYNRSGSTIELRDFKITDQSDTATLTSFDLLNDQFITLSSTANEASFSVFGSAIGLQSFPSLSNSGETLILLDRNDEIIDTLAYTVSFYNDETKEDGGYTIELINPDKPCYDVANYGASTNANGGTPGTQNSIFDNTPDTTAPSVNSLTVNSTTSLSLVFSEAMDVSTLIAANFNVGGSIAVSSVTINDDFGTNLELTLAAPLTRGTTQSLNIVGVNDCSGNALNGSESFVLGAIPTANQLLITEIMASPSPPVGLPEREYVELFNNSNLILDLSEVSLIDNAGAQSLEATSLAAGEYIIITSNVGEPELNAFGTTMGINSFPTLSADDQVGLVNSSNDTIFYIDYNQSFYNDEAKEDGGYSIEMINPNPGCFTVANYGASTNANGGTPGTQNSIFDNTPDTTAPSVSSLTVNSTTSLSLVFSEAMDVSTLIAANFNVGGSIAVSSITINDDFGTNLELTLAASFTRGTTQSLNIVGVNDCSRNALNGSESFVLGAIPTANQLLITEIMASPSPPVGLPEREYVELFNNSNLILDLSEISLIDNAGAQSLEATSLAAGEYIIITSNAGESELNAFGTTMGINSFPTLSANDQVGLVNSSNDTIFYIDYDEIFYNDETKEGGGYSIEMINPNPSCYDNANWAASTNINGGTPGTQNSIFDNSADTQSPTVNSHSTTSLNQLAITFSESMDISTLIIGNFSIDNGLNVADIDIQDQFGSNVLINLQTPYSAGVLYTLTLTGLTDCAGNALPSTQLIFSRGAEPSANQLIITEIMASPSPTQGLPEREYLELLNTSSEILSMEGVILSDATSSTTLGSFDLNPGERLLLTPSSDASALNGFGNVLGVSNWPNLNSTSDRLRLHNPSNQEIFRVNYSDSWYANATKAQGGFSLEMIDTNYPCLEESNWRASDSPNGGTPGSVNSVDGSNPDLVGPSMTLAVATDVATIQVNFNEKLNINAIAPSDFSSNNGISFISGIVGEDEKSVTLTTNVDLTPNTIYTLNANNITDCTGNLISINGNSFDVIVAAEANPLDILVNEILFNPNSGGVRFVEIYNNSSKYINLKDWKVAGLNNSRSISDENLFIEPSQYLTITSDGNVLTAEYPNTVTSSIVEVSSMPSLPASGGTVFIYDDQDNTIDSFDFDELNHSPLLSETKGVSLERISFAGPSNDPNNWFSASQTEGFATPGYINSQSSNINPPSGMVQVDPPSFAPDIPGASNFTMLNYQFDDPGNTVTIKIVNASGDVVRTLVQNALVGKEGFFTWDGTLSNGGKARVGYYMVLMEVITTTGQVNYIKDRVAIGSRF